MRARTDALAELLLSRPWISWVVLGAIALIGAGALPWVKIEAGLGTFFDRTSPLQAQLDEVEAQFVSDDVIFVLYRSEDVLSRQNLALARSLGQRLEELQLPSEGESPLFPLEDVTSLATVDTLVGSDQTFRTVPLLPDPIPQTPEGLQLLRDRLQRNPIVRAGLVSEDRRVALLALRLTAGLTDEQQAEAVGAVRELVSAAGAAHPGTELHVFGDAVLEADSARYQTRALEQFIPLVYGLIILFLFLFLRRALGVAVAMVNCTIALIAGVGLLVLTGSSINNCSVMIPPLVVSLGVASMVHLFSEYGNVSAQWPHERARQTVLSQLMVPLAMASLTTAVAFGSLATSPIPAIHEFGIAAGAAMLALLVISVTLTTLAWRRWPPDRLVSPRGLARSGALETALAGLAEFLIRQRRPVLLVGVVATLLLGVGLARITVDQNQIEFFEPDAPVRRANTVLEEHLPGSTLLVISLRGNRDNQFLEPAELAKLQQLQRYLEDEVGVDLVTSIVDYLSLMHREFHAGDPRQHRIPDTAQQAAQLLLLNGDTTIDEFIDPSYRWVRIVARSKEHRTSALDRICKRLDAFLGQRFPEAQGYRAYTTGGSRLYATVFTNLIYSQTLSLSLSVVLIFGMMFVMFRSLVAALYCVPPNAFPILCVLGLMGWLGIHLDAATTMTSTVALGIAVDDTIHFVEYYRACLGRKLAPEQALRETLQVKGPAIVGTSTVIGLGFLVLLVADFVPTQNFGLLTAAAMFAAIIGDLLFLPALLLTTGTRLGTGKRD